MTQRFLISSLAVGLLALGGLKAQAGTIPLPASLASLEGNSATVGNLEFSFSNTAYTVNPMGSAPSASDVTVNPFTAVQGEPGITFNGTFTAPANSTVDYAMTYTVTTTDGSKISDAYLSLGGFANSGGAGSVKIGETILNSAGTTISKVPFQVYTPGQTSDTTVLTSPETTITVQKDITVLGGSNGATFSFTNQAFSTDAPAAAIPEPTSMALLGIGLSGLFTLRRFFKRTSVA